MRILRWNFRVNFAFISGCDIHTDVLRAVPNWSNSANFEKFLKFEKETVQAI